MYPHDSHYNRPYPDEVCRRLRQGKQIIEIILMKEEIIHDIDTDTLNIEKSRNVDQTPVATDERRRYEACRHIDRAVNNCVKRCAAYLLLPSPFVRRIATDHAGAWEEKNIFIGLPHNWPPHLINALRDAVHNFIVHKVVTYFMVLHLPNDPYTTICAQQAERAYNDINAHLNARLGPTHIQPSFLG